MTATLYREDGYLRSCQARVLQAGEDGVALDRTVLFAGGGGQPGDTGTLVHGGGEAQVTDTVWDGDGVRIWHRIEGGIEQGAEVIASVDWQRRYLTMRTHTALHLLYAAVQLPVTGGRMTPGRGRLDFDMPEPPDREAIERRLAELVAADAAVTTRWTDWAYLDSHPELVKTMAVKPPRTQERVSLVDIEGIDVQACGGTHVKSTGEVGQVRIAKVEKKGRLNRRMVIEIVDG